MTSMFKFNSSRKRVSPVLQTEATECGLACVAMISAYFDNNISLRELRLHYPVSLKGASLGSVMRVCKHVGLSTRPIRTEIEGLKHTRLPCILHWNFNHLVVLESITEDYASIVDPVGGARDCDMADFSKSFTGVALEVWPGSDFTQQEKPSDLSIRQIIGKVQGLRNSAFALFGLALVLEIFTSIAPYFLQLVIDAAILTGDRNTLALICGGFILILLLKDVLTGIRSWFLMYLGNQLNIQWKTNIFHHLMSLPIDYFEKRHAGDVASRFLSVDAIQKMLTTAFIESAIDGLMSFVVLVVLFLYSPQLAALVLLSCVFYVGVRTILNKYIWTAARDEVFYSAKQQSHLLETIRGIRTIKLLNKETQRVGAWLSFYGNQISAKVAVQKIEIFNRLSRLLIFDLQNIAIVWFGAALVIEGKYSLGVLMAFLSYKLLLESRVSAFVDNIYTIKNINLQCERLADILLTTPEKRATHQDPVKIVPKLEFRNVYFQYALFEEPVLRNISFSIEEAESVAIVGPSGCGKSTIAKVLLGIHNSTSGQIMIGESEVRFLGAERLRDLISAVLQDDVLFSGSIMDNISSFDDNIDFLWMDECARLANIRGDIVAMPMQYSTLIGDMGTVLSGGQKQRILIARAIYRKPRILIMDEATSHLDLENEKMVSAAIKSLRITRILIAHRKETILSADRVFVMSNGEIQHIFDKEAASKWIEAMAGEANF